MAYATVEDVQARMLREMTQTEQDACAVMLDDAAIVIDAFAPDATNDAKKLVSCRMCERAIGDGDTGGVPIGATQGSMSGLGYSQSWTLANGATGELYLSKLDKQLLGLGNRIGAYSPVEALVPRVETS